MQINKIEAIVHNWCKSKSFVHRAWLFGSRVQNTHSPDSDIDIAVESLPAPNPLASGPNDSYSLASDSGRWKDELEKLLGIPVHYLKMPYPDDALGKNATEEKIRKSGRLVYEHSSVHDKE